MSFIRINNLDVSALIDGFSLDDASVETYDRTLNDSLEGTTYSVKKTISFSTDYLTGSDASALEGWVRGRGHQWTFERYSNNTTQFSLFSNEGGVAMVGFNYYGAVTGTEPFGTQLLGLNPGGTTTVTVPFGTETDLTIAYMNRGAATATWQHYALIRKSGATSLWKGFQGASSSTIPSLVGLSVTAVSGFTMVTFSSADGVTSSITALFDRVLITPYAMTVSMLSARSTASLNEVPLPFVGVSGDALPLAATATGAEPGPITMKASVKTLDYKPVVVDGVFRYNARAVKITLEQR